MLSRIIIFLIIMSIYCARNIVPEIDPLHSVSNVVIVILDGARFSETYGDTLDRYTPFLNDTLTKLGTICTKFYNSGYTYTISGHAAITTGYNLIINNGGYEMPSKPSIFQSFLASTNLPKSKAWLITSKDKLEILANCSDELWNDKYIPSFDCGISGMGSGYRNDSITVEKVIDVIEEDSPNLVLLNFRDPDQSGHTGVWENYETGLKNSDHYVSKLWHYLEKNPNYKDNTTFIVTSDHGRHLDSVSNGFSSHGDDCDGCRHVAFWAYGANVKEGFTDTITYDLRDISSTIAYLLNIKDISDSSDIMYSFLKKIK